jgi:hypothetical protein
MLVVSQEDYNAGNYPKDTPIMVGMTAGMSGKSSMNAGKTKIVIKLKAA